MTDEESEALLQALRLAQINCDYYSIANKGMLTRCINEIDTLDPTTTRFVVVKENDKVTPHPLGRTVNLRTLHFSAHGNEDGIGLTSGEFVSWKDLGDYLYGMRTMTEVPAGNPGFVLVSMSTCSGLHASKMARANDLPPYFALVGPNKSVTWADSLTAWVTFYHLFIMHDVPPREAAIIMNKAAGLPDGTFCCIDWNDVRQSAKIV